MADVTRKSLLALNSGLNGVRHFIERNHEIFQVGVLFVRQTRVKSASSDFIGSFCDST